MAQAKTKKKTVDREPTRRVLLTGAKMKFGDLPTATRDKLSALLTHGKPEASEVEIWVAVKTVEGTSVSAVVDATTNDEDGSEVPGLYRAVPLKSWATAVERVEPAQTKLDTKVTKYAG